MILIVQRRAEIALRSLQAFERCLVNRALEELLAVDKATLRANRKIHALKSDRSEKQLFVYKGSPKLRLVVSFPDEDTCLVQDIVDHDRLDRLVRREGQE